MTETRHYCDRCRDPILDGRTVLTVECGPLRQAGTDVIDLCPGCAGRLTNFLKTPPADARQESAA